MSRKEEKAPAKDQPTTGEGLSPNPSGDRVDEGGNNTSGGAAPAPASELGDAPSLGEPVHAPGSVVDDSAGPAPEPETPDVGERGSRFTEGDKK